MSALYPDLPLTTFPSGGIDTFTTWINIVASDGPLIAQYQAAMEAGNQTQANQILAQIPQGTQKIITAIDLNKLTQAIQAVERFYKTDIKPYIQNQQENWLNIINQFSYQGVWESGTSYVINNLVSYTVSGLNFVYIATSTPPVGTPPTNTQYWRLLTIQGQQGDSGEGLSYREEWVNSNSYAINDAVTYNGAIWMAVQPNRNIEPSSNSQYWKLVMNLETTAYPIQDTVPTNLQVGGLWFNTSNNPTQYIYEGDVQDGKTLIATAITNKGVTTSSSDSFAQMAANIEQIQSSNIETSTVVDASPLDFVAPNAFLDITTFNDTDNKLVVDSYIQRANTTYNNVVTNTIILSSVNFDTVTGGVQKLSNTAIKVTGDGTFTLAR